MSSDIALDEAPLGEEVPDTAVEHAGVEVDALVPRLEHELVLMVDELLLIGVVGIDDILPVGEVEEVVSLVDHVVEVVLSIAALVHRSAPVIL